MRKKPVISGWLFAILIVIGIGSRVASHTFPELSNFTALGAVALFVGYRMPRAWWACLAPMAAMLVGDAALSALGVPSASLKQRLVIYACFAASVPLGWWIEAGVSRSAIARRWSALAIAAVVSATLFYLATNVVWLYSPKMYDRSWAGQIASYAAAAPFFWRMLLGNLVYGTAIFGVAEAWAWRTSPKPVTAPAIG